MFFLNTFDLFLYYNNSFVLQQKMVKRKDKPTDLKTHSLEIYEFLTGYKKEYQL